MIDKNPRRFILTVTEVDANLLPHVNNDEIHIVFAGKVFPSTLKRLKKCVEFQDISFQQKQLL